MSTAKLSRGYITRLCLEISEKGSSWEAWEVCYKHEQPLKSRDYGAIVSAVVRSKYTADEVEAIILNHDTEERTEEHEQEFEALQEWRRAAKELAKLAVGE